MSMMLMLTIVGLVSASMTMTNVESKPDVPVVTGAGGGNDIHIGGGNLSAEENTLEILSDSDDGRFANTDASYNTARTDAVSDFMEDTGEGIWVGQRFTTSYQINRGCLFFDTSHIPASAVIVSAKLRLYQYLDISTNDFDIVVQNGQPIYPSKPIQVSDYSYLLYSGDGGSFNTSGFTDSGNPFDINLSVTGLSWINRSGFTKFMLRSNKDINGNAPIGKEYSSFYSYEQGAPYIPKLTVTYTLTPSTHLVGNLHLGHGG